MRYIALLISVVCSSVFGEQVSIPIPDRGWSVKFDAPPMTKLGELNEANRYVYTSGGGRYNLSLFVDRPGCAGGGTHEGNYKCFAQKAERLPGLVRETYTAAKTPRAVEVAYLMRVPSANGSIPVMNVHLLFAHNGAWGDLHYSIVRPTDADLESIKTLQRSFQYGVE